jgi:hypothetical protein
MRISPIIVRNEDEMNELTPRQLRGLFTAIEVNLLLWLTVCGALWSSASVEDHVKYFATAGMIVAAGLQHWAYYNLYRKAKQAKKQNSEQAPGHVR